ncbi:hypothetical protein D9756_008988 [Leucocoprinus leucothites]|uniref:DUF6699 domain-containing protein n=1 Tax=Leucocoprinus leucothites TaxID=201217 RepID=A0A8H5FUX0_9AGAR|nr:hypothetical protein D9756_008988 [Leucoagaricus leucothites]
MSGQTTPFIPPLGTPSPETRGFTPPVVPTSPPTSQSSRSRPPSASGPPPGWGAQASYQMPFYGVGAGTPYNQAPFIPLSPYSQGPPSGAMGGFTPLPPVGPNGLSMDYRGYPDFLPPTPLMTGGGPPVNPPVIPHGTPWHGGGGTMPLHHGQPPNVPPASPWGMGQPGAMRAWPAAGPYPAGAFGGGGGGGAWGAFGTPEPAWGNMNLSAMGGGGGLGGWPGVHPGVQPSIQQEPPRRYDKEAGDRMPKFTAGPHYGPVLDALQLRVVGAILELNPLLTPVPESGPESEKIYLRWNMLMESSLVHRSCDPLQVSWSAGRNEPATFPRLSVLKIVSEHFPWLIEVKARNPDAGVTCGEVIEAIAQNMDKLTSKSDYEVLPNSLKKMVLDAYRYNRSRNPDVPGGKMGDGLKRVDFLGQMTAFGGLEVDPGAIGRVCGVVVPGYVLLRCDKREFMTPEEVRAQHARERAASQVPLPPSRSASSRGSRGPGSVAGSTRSGIGVDVESPSDESDSTD